MSAKEKETLLDDSKWEREYYMTLTLENEIKF